MANQSLSDDVGRLTKVTDSENTNTKISNNNQRQGQHQTRRSKLNNQGTFKNVIVLSILLSLLKIVSPEASLQDMSLLPTVNAMEVNPNDKRALFHHPIVFQADDSTTTTDTGEEEETEEPQSNSTNQFGYPFQDYTVYEQTRKSWGAYLLGAQADFFASNATTCFVNTLNLAQYDLELLIIKLMYGNLKNNMLNTTLFLKNVSDLSYICLDALENNYVFWVYKIDSFGRDGTQIMLGWLQNVLGNVLSINKLVQKAVEYNDANETEKMMYILGQITYIMLDFEPIVLDDAGFGKNIDLDGEIYLQGEPAINESLKRMQDKSKTKVKGWYESRYGVNQTFHTHQHRPKNSSKHPLVKQDTPQYDIEGLNNLDISSGFGILDAVPGLRYLFKLSAPSNMVRGFINGSQIIQDKYMQRCDNLVALNLVNETERLANLTLTVFQEDDFYETVFYIFDVALLATKILSQFHPIAFNCYNAGETTWFYYYDVFAVKNGLNPKNYIMNIIYNFGHIFDSFRDAWLFIVQDPRGQITNVYDCGFSLGWASYMIITPGLAIYQTDVNKQTSSERILNPTNGTIDFDQFDQP